MVRLWDSLKILEEEETLLFPEAIAEGDVAHVHRRGTMCADCLADCGTHACITWEKEKDRTATCQIVYNFETMPKKKVETAGCSDKGFRWHGGKKKQKTSLLLYYSSVRC